MLIDEAETVDDAEHERLVAKADADGITPTFERRRVSTATDSLHFLDAVSGTARATGGRARGRGRTCTSRALPDAGSIRNIVVLGMGGSGIAGDVIAAAFNDELPVPITVLKQYRTPAFVGPGTLAFAVSYSGDTEETVSMATAAVEERRVARRRVARWRARRPRARRTTQLHVPCPDGYLPRAAIGALVAPIVVVLFRLGLAPGAPRAARTRTRAARAPAQRSASRGRGRGEPGA